MIHSGLAEKCWKPVLCLALRDRPTTTQYQLKRTRFETKCIPEPQGSRRINFNLFSSALPARSGKSEAGWLLWIDAKTLVQKPERPPEIVDKGHGSLAGRGAYTGGQAPGFRQFLWAQRFRFCFEFSYKYGRMTKVAKKFLFST